MSKDAQSNPSSNDPSDSIVPSVDDVADFLLYGLSLPERALRSSSAAVSGAVRQSTSLLIPQAFRSSKSYTVFVEQMLDFMAHDIGGVDRDEEANKPHGSASDAPAESTEHYVARKAVGGFCLLYTSPSPRDKRRRRMPSSA